MRTIIVRRKTQVATCHLGTSPLLWPPCTLRAAECGFRFNLSQVESHATAYSTALRLLWDAEPFSIKQTRSARPSSERSAACLQYYVGAHILKKYCRCDDHPARHGRGRCSDCMRKWGGCGRAWTAWATLAHTCKAVKGK